jgi:DNA-binding PadR family transcriptional regulator
MAMSNLVKYGYIQRDTLDVLLIKLTEKGVNELEKLENKTKIKDSQAKIQGLLNSFKDSHALKRNVEERPERNVRQLIQTRYENQLILVIDSR